jgi:thymidylate synthase
MHTDASTRFDHTYPERFWPKHAGHDHDALGARWRDAIDATCGGTPGIRFHYGDLSDVVDLLVRSPLTRQAFLPVWFPEDTGAVDGQRVPCTLGYHFMQREGRLSCRYYLRSCDLYRHLSNDVYFAARLTEWVADKVWQKTRDRPQKVSMRPGGLVMHISSLHSFEGDTKKIKDRIDHVSRNDDEVWGFPA